MVYSAFLAVHKPQECLFIGEVLETVSAVVARLYDPENLVVACCRPKVVAVDRQPVEKRDPLFALHEDGLHDLLPANAADLLRPVEEVFLAAVLADETVVIQLFENVQPIMKRRPLRAVVETINECRVHGFAEVCRVAAHLVDDLLLVASEPVLRDGAIGSIGGVEHVHGMRSEEVGVDVLIAGEVSAFAIQRMRPEKRHVDEYGDRIDIVVLIGLFLADMGERRHEPHRPYDNGLVFGIYDGIRVEDLHPQVREIDLEVIELHVIDAEAGVVEDDERIHDLRKEHDLLMPGQIDHAPVHLDPVEQRRCADELGADVLHDIPDPSVHLDQLNGHHERLACLSALDELFDLGKKLLLVARVEELQSELLFALIVNAIDVALPRSDAYDFIDHIVVAVLALELRPFIENHILSSLCNLDSQASRLGEQPVDKALVGDVCPDTQELCIQVAIRAVRLISALCGGHHRLKLPVFDELRKPQDDESEPRLRIPLLDHLVELLAVRPTDFGSPHGGVFRIEILRLQLLCCHLGFELDIRLKIGKRERFGGKRIRNECLAEPAGVGDGFGDVLCELCRKEIGAGKATDGRKRKEPPACAFEYGRFRDDGIRGKSLARKEHPHLVGRAPVMRQSDVNHHVVIPHSAESIVIGDETANALHERLVVLIGLLRTIRDAATLARRRIVKVLVEAIDTLVVAVAKLLVVERDRDDNLLAGSREENVQTVETAVLADLRDCFVNGSVLVAAGMTDADADHVRFLPLSIFEGAHPQRIVRQGENIGKSAILLHPPLDLIVDGVLLLIVECDDADNLLGCCRFDLDHLLHNSFRFGEVCAPRRKLGIGHLDQLVSKRFGECRPTQVNIGGDVEKSVIATGVRDGEQMLRLGAVVVLQLASGELPLYDMEDRLIRLRKIELFTACHLIDIALSPMAGDVELKRIAEDHELPIVDQERQNVRKRHLRAFIDDECLEAIELVVVHEDAWRTDDDGTELDDLAPIGVEEVLQADARGGETVQKFYKLAPFRRFGNAPSKLLLDVCSTHVLHRRSRLEEFLVEHFELLVAVAFQLQRGDVSIGDIAGNLCLNGRSDVGFCDRLFPDEFKDGDAQSIEFGNDVRKHFVLFLIPRSPAREIGAPIVLGHGIHILALEFAEFLHDAAVVLEAEVEETTAVEVFGSQPLADDVIEVRPEFGDEVVNAVELIKLLDRLVVLGNNRPCFLRIHIDLRVSEESFDLGDDLLHARALIQNKAIEVKPTAAAVAYEYLVRRRLLAHHANALAADEEVCNHIDDRLALARAGACMDVEALPCHHATDHLALAIVCRERIECGSRPQVVLRDIVRSLREHGCEFVSDDLVHVALGCLAHDLIRAVEDADMHIVVVDTRIGKLGDVLADPFQALFELRKFDFRSAASFVKVNVLLRLQHAGKNGVEDELGSDHVEPRASLAVQVLFDGKQEQRRRDANAVALLVDLLRLPADCAEREIEDVDCLIFAGFCAAAAENLPQRFHVTILLLGDGKELMPVEPVGLDIFKLIDVHENSVIGEERDRVPVPRDVLTAHEDAARRNDVALHLDDLLNAGRNDHLKGLTAARRKHLADARRRPPAQENRTGADPNKIGCPLQCPCLLDVFVNERGVLLVFCELFLTHHEAFLLWLKQRDDKTDCHGCDCCERCDDLQRHLRLDE